MLTISKALSAKQAQTYHAREFASEQQNYWSQDRQAHSEWRGALAEDWNLHGAVHAEHFANLSDGQHPDNGAQLVKHQPARTYENEYGKQITSVEHRAGWDATFSAPKSVSLTALVGGDVHVRKAHRESVRVALGELERYTQARIGNIHSPENTGKFLAATFEHDTARPVDGYAAPQLHTHAVVFNMTVCENGQSHALQERSLFQSQHYATSVYRSELAIRLQKLGYEIEIGKHGQPEIKGYTQEYLDASSPRREQIKEHLQEIGRGGAGAAQVAAHRTRDKKEIQPQDEVLRRHRELAVQFGNQADRVVAQAREHAYQFELRQEKTAQLSATYARNHVFEHSAVQDERTILQSMLDRGMGKLTYGEARQELSRRVESGEFCAIGPKEGRAASQYTTAEMVRMEESIIAGMQQGNRGDFMLVSPQVRIWTEDRHPELNASQLRAVDEIFLAREKIVGLEGVAGTGKTTTIRMICGLLIPDTGSGSCLGFDLMRESRQIKRNVGYMTQRFSYWEDLTVRENLDFVARVYGLDDRRKRVEEAIEDLGLGARANQLAGSMSGGWKQRVALAACMLHKPQLLLLDEPTAGVDPTARRDFWKELHRLAATGVSVLVSTHYMDEASRCHKLAYIAYGKLLAQGTEQEIIAAEGLHSWQLRGGALAHCSAEAEKLPGVDQVIAFGMSAHVSGRDEAQLCTSMQKLATMDNAPQMQEIETGLEDVFIHLMNRSKDNFGGAA